MEEHRKGVNVRIAGNTGIPALLALRAKGYRLLLEYWKVKNPSNQWYPLMPNYEARSDVASFSATTPEELLGLVAMWETRGDDWKFKTNEPNVLDELTSAAKTLDEDEEGDIFVCE